MDAEALRAVLRRKPFEAFRLTTNDGQSFDVNGPEWAVVTNTTTAVGVQGVPGDRNNMVILANETITTVMPLHLADPRG